MHTQDVINSIMHSLERMGVVCSMLIVLCHRTTAFLRVPNTSQYSLTWSPICQVITWGSGHNTHQYSSIKLESTAMKRCVPYPGNCITG